MHDELWRRDRGRPVDAGQVPPPLDRSRLLRWERLDQGKRLDDHVGVRDFVEGGFLFELVALLGGLPEHESGLLFSASPDAWPHSDRIEGTPIVGRRRVLALIEEIVPADCNRGDALAWKRATIDGRIVELYRALRGRHVIVVGPRTLRHLPTFLGLDSCHHLEIPLRTARRERERLSDRLLAEIGAHPGPAVVLLQAGSLATWLILRLHGRVGNACLLDLGGALDLCSIPTLLEKNWARVYRAEVARTIVRTHPDWPRRPEAYGPPTTPRERREGWFVLSRGLDLRTATVLGGSRLPERPTTLAPSVDDVTRVDFVERKAPDLSRLAALLEPSRATNRWANRGPASRGLEEAVATLVGVGADRAVVACSSGTAALFAVVGARHYLAGRPLRWVVSAFGFHSTRLGPLADARVLDCDPDGLLDLRALADLPSESWDGVVVTNPFGLRPDWEPFVRLCERRGKIVVYDNAHALLGCDRGLPGAPDEIVSFHHTKPWGAGEGGCAIVSRELEPIVRALIRFGAGLGEGARPLGFNGKISDVSSALILERLERLPAWHPLYHLQERRIIVLGAEAGLRPLAPLSWPPRSSAVLLAESPIPRRAILDRAIGLEKYYLPLSNRAPNARRLYEHVLNVPCHPGMAALPGDEIVAILRDVLRASRTGPGAGVRRRVTGPEARRAS